MIRFTQHFQEICLFTDYKLDESYTASKISLREGTDLYDLHVSLTLTHLALITALIFGFIL